MSTTTTTQRPKSFGSEADAFLDAFYKTFTADTTQKRIALLQDNLGGESSFYALGGDINDDMKLACLEYEYLEQMGKLKLVLA